MSMRPVAVYGLKVRPDGFFVDSRPDMPASVRITMAAIDPTEELSEVLGSDEPLRATLKMVRSLEPDLDGYDSDDLDGNSDDPDVEAIKRRLGIVEGDDDVELQNGGPSDPKKREKARKAAMIQALIDEENEDMDEDDDAELTNGVNGKFDKGKAKALDDVDEDEEDEDSDEDSEDDEDDFQELVLCTLDAKQQYQQPLDITITEDERVFFVVEGTHSIHLTGNFIVPEDEIVSEDEEDEGSESDEVMDGLDEELLGSLQDDYDDSEEDEEDDLDDLEDPRVIEVDSDDEEAPKLVKATTTITTTKKSKNKRPAEESDEDEIATEEVIKNILKAEDDKKTSKRQAKKQKNNAGQAISGAPEEKEKQSKKDDQSPSNGKKVQFAEKLEQGPTGGAKTTQKGPRVVNGVTVDDKKSGSGPGAKKGDKIGMRYIGKLKDGKVFDSNKKGQPFKFKLGQGEVIKGWDIGVQGMSVGGERRITVPAKLAYGSKSMPGIPSNSDLVFDLKLISIN